jgi:hypothetical protein
MIMEPPAPLALSLSKGFPSLPESAGEGFDKLRPNGWGSI